MKFSIINIKNCTIGLAVLSVIGSSCKKDGNPNNLPSVSPDAYVGKIDGYTSSDEIYPEKLVAYWSFDDTKNEIKSGTAPTQTANDAFVTGGVRGKALSLNAGYLFYGTQFQKFKTDSLKSFSVSEWIQVSNNGSKRTMIFEIARPGIFTGDLDFAVNTNSYPSTNTTDLKVQPKFTTVGGGTQDNLNNANGAIPYVTAPSGPGKWIHLVITYDSNTGVFNLWINGVLAGGYPNRGTGNNLFKAWEPNQVIIGGNYNTIPGMSVSTDVSFAAMTGLIDEIRVFNFPLPDAHIKALYKLGLANK